jgi:hypothetical protein
LKIVSLFILLFAFQFSSYGQPDWTIEKEKDGIRISSRPAASSQFNDIRVELDLPGNIDQLKKILLDVDHYNEWSYATRKSILIKQISPGKLIYYSEFEVPWPATNRYFYANIDLREDTLGHSLNMIAVNLKNYAPVQKDLVEVTSTRGNWKITTTSKKSIHVDYMLELNPGGTLPSWIINMFATKGPFETFENIKKKMTDLNAGKGN